MFIAKNPYKFLFIYDSCSKYLGRPFWILLALNSMSGWFALAYFPAPYFGNLEILQKNGAANMACLAKKKLKGKEAYCLTCYRTQ